MKTLSALCTAPFVVLLAMTFPAGAGRSLCKGTQVTDWTITEGEAGLTYASGTPGDDVFAAAPFGTGPFVIFGLAGDDIICGSAAADVIYAGAGNDIVRGKGGADSIYGEAGNDILRGGRGADSIRGGDGADVIRASKIDIVDGAEPDRPKKPRPKVTADPTPKPKPKVTADPTPKPRPKVTADPTPKPTPKVTATPTPKVTATPTPTPTATPIASATPIETPAPPPSGSFQVVGRQILDPAGEVFLPVGANVSPPLRDSQGDCIWWLSLRCSDMTGRLASVQAWNWNTLRLNLQCGYHNNVNTGAPYGPTEMLAATDQIVEEYTAAGVVVILDCHTHVAENPPVGGAVWNELTSFWDQAIARYGDNPYVWINFANEYEATGGWDETYFKQFTEAAYAHLTGAGYDGVMLMDLPNFGQHIQFFYDAENVTWAEQFDQVVWDWHAYGGVSRSGKVSDVYRGMTYGEMSGIYDTILANLAANDLPVLVGEFGHDWNDGRRTDGGWSYVSMVNSARLNVERLTDAGIGMTVWHANGSSGIRMEYGLKASDDLTFDEPTVDSNLSTLGQLYWDLTRTLGG